MEYINLLKKMQNNNFAEFQAKMMPTVKRQNIIGVRTPELRKLAKEIVASEKYEKFLDELPHKYFDENQLHSFILSEMKDYNICIKKVNEFLPYIDNWATCDQLSPKCFKKHKNELIPYIKKWLKSKKAYIIRFAVEMLMSHYLDEDFDEEYLKMVADVKFGKSANSQIEKINIDINPDKYYVEMMRAWFFATALAKQYKATFPYIKNKKLNVWTHNKTIQKACESYRVSENKKKILKKLKVE